MNYFGRRTYGGEVLVMSVRVQLMTRPLKWDEHPPNLLELVVVKIAGVHCQTIAKEDAFGVVDHKLIERPWRGRLACVSYSISSLSIQLNFNIAGYCCHDSLCFTLDLRSQEPSAQLPDTIIIN